MSDEHNNRLLPFTAEALDAKEGTTGGVVRGSSLSVGPAPAVDSAVDLKGSQWRLEGNTISGPVDAVSIHVILDPWGAGNVVAGNLLRPGPDGVGVPLGSGSRRGDGSSRRHAGRARLIACLRALQRVVRTPSSDPGLVLCPERGADKGSWVTPSGVTVQKETSPWQQCAR